MNVSVKTVNMKNGEQKVKLESPFHPDMSREARAIGGDWNGGAKAWYFDVRDEQRVRNLAIKLFGTDGSAPIDLVDVRVTLSGRGSQEEWRFGRLLAKRWSRDAPVSLGDGVVVIEGQFSKSGGSRNYPRVDWIGDSITLEVRDVPRSMVDDDTEIVSEKPAPVNPNLAALKDLMPNLTDEEIIGAALAHYHTKVVTGK